MADRATEQLLSSFADHLLRNRLAPRPATTPPAEGMLTFVILRLDIRQSAVRME